MKVKDLREGRAYLTRFGTMRLMGFDLYGFAVFECVVTGERRSMLAADVVAAADATLSFQPALPFKTEG